MFCMAYAQTCANYPAFSDQKGCMESFYNTPLGEMSDTAGDSQGCRRYHLGAAKGNPALHCDHAAGLAVCVAKTTGAPEGSPSEEFCDNYFLTEGVCNAYNSYSTKAACVKDYKLTPLGNKNDQVGNTRACREYHISVAPSGPMFHCPHAAGDSICVGEDPTDPGEKFCQGFEAVCNKFNPYNDTQSCVASFKNTPEGNTQDDSGNSQGCRNYHLGAALGNAALHCPHAAGMAVCVGESSSTKEPASTTNDPSAKCPKNCGTAAMGGGTCETTSDGYQNCTSCNSNKILAHGGCVQSIACRKKTVLSGKFTGLKCRCSNKHCHYCIQAPAGETCKRCRDGWYMLDEDCVESCPSSMSSSGVSTFGRRCHDPFTCSGGRVKDSSTACKCPNTINKMPGNCHVCEHQAGAFGQYCTRCRDKMFLDFDSNTCIANCDDKEGMVSYDATSFGRECRKPFTCADNKDEAGIKCKCPKSIRSSCLSCDYALDGNTCNMCIAKKVLHKGNCIKNCPDGFTANGDPTKPGRECVGE